MFPRIRLISLAAISGFLWFIAAWAPRLAHGEEGVESAPAAQVEASEVDPLLIENPMESQLVQVDWLEEMFEGGLTMVALAILSIGMLAVLLERLITLRRGKFMPPALLKEVRPMFHERRYDDILAACKRQPSTASEIICHLVEFRGTNFDVLQSGATDIGARAVLDQEEKCNPLSVIAGIAPLLGLLGTMIGMIEAFKLVEVFGDEGGASLLAGSISKALITTAVGLILAIPALLGYHWSRRRVHHIASSIEVESEALLKDWFLNRK
ncbi:biopolymer transport protein ExbB/TolQ [Haloferula luteola]|uniref:Biopolymer transport protein ExbB/TolQ n=1 Tax=Haloferula luteola TaxID=595692 RepID=A0A840VDV7_9BACT|nr:MotA/TolQ/ExbB proton channel family protein [Haloferula luteola]MBB5352060.1 biopolymer transport protein ExbB/TolQ [Haloferula luteola]